MLSKALKVVLFYSPPYVSLWKHACMSKYYQERFPNMKLRREAIKALKELMSRDSEKSVGVHLLDWIQKQTPLPDFMEEHAAETLQLCNFFAYGDIKWERKISEKKFQEYQDWVFAQSKVFYEIMHSLEDDMELED